MQQSNIFLDQREHVFVGIHILAEVYGVDGKKLDNSKLLIDSMIKGIELSGATLCDIISTQFEPYGCTVVAVLSESHVSIHTYPELGSAFIDAFTCGVSCKSEKIIEQLNSDLSAEHIVIKKIKRG